MGGFVQYLAIAACSLNEMKGRVGAGRTRSADADQFLQPTLLRASPETPLLRASLVAGLPLAINPIHKVTSRNVMYLCAMKLVKTGMDIPTADAMALSKL